MTGWSWKGSKTVFAGVCKIYGLAELCSECFCKSSWIGCPFFRLLGLCHWTGWSCKQDSSSWGPNGPVSRTWWSWHLGWMVLERPISYWKLDMPVWGCLPHVVGHLCDLECGWLDILEGTCVCTCPCCHWFPLWMWWICYDFCRGAIGVICSISGVAISVICTAPTIAWEGYGQVVKCDNLWSPL